MSLQPSVYATSTRPDLSMVASLKSSRLRQALEPPPFQMQPRWTGLLGAPLYVFQCLPPSYVSATYRNQVPQKASAWSSPALSVPRKAYAARSSSPATTSGNFEFWMPKVTPASADLDHVLP